MYLFLRFNYSFYLRQKLCSLPYKLHHSVRDFNDPHGIAIKKRVTQIFLAFGFDKFVLLQFIQKL